MIASPLGSALLVAFLAEALSIMCVRHQDGAAYGALSAASMCPETVLGKCHDG